jgi:hypothetical protein
VLWCLKFSGAGELPTRYTGESSLVYSTSWLIFPEIFSSLAEILNGADINYIICEASALLFHIQNYWVISGLPNNSPNVNHQTKQPWIVPRGVLAG